MPEGPDGQKRNGDVIGAGENRRLKRPDRMVLRAEDLSDAQMEAILTAEIAKEAYAFNHEVEP